MAQNRVDNAPQTIREIRHKKCYSCLGTTAYSEELTMRMDSHYFVSGSVYYLHWRIPDYLLRKMQQFHPPIPTPLHNVSVHSLLVRKDKKKTNIPLQFFVSLRMCIVCGGYCCIESEHNVLDLNEFLHRRRFLIRPLLLFIIHRVAELWLKSNIKLAGKIFILFLHDAIHRLSSIPIACELMRAKLGITIANMTEWE